MRIASLSPAVTEILFAFGKQDQIVCLDQFSDAPEGARHIPHISGHAKIDPDALRDYDVDLVFTETVIQEKLADLLRAHGFSVVHHDPRTLHHIYEGIRNLGTILDCEQKGHELILSMQQGLNDVKKKAGKLPRKLKVYIEEWPEVSDSESPAYASGNWVPEVARFAGCDQFPVPAGALSPEVSLEEVKGWDPDMIVISWCGAGSSIEKEVFLKRDGWDTLRAVQEGQIRVIDDALFNRPGPRLVEGAQRLFGWAFEMLH